MKKASSTVKNTILLFLAGVAAVTVAKEVPAMVRYFKMKRL